MSKKILLLTLMAFAFIGLEGSGHNAMSDCNIEAYVGMETWCPLRVKYKDCQGVEKTDVIVSLGVDTRTYEVSDPTLKFECAGGLAPTQTVELLKPYPSGITCSGGLGGGI